MKSQLHAWLLVFCVGSVVGGTNVSAQQLEWVRQLGFGAIDSNYGVTADSLGNVFVSGNTLSADLFGTDFAFYAYPYMSKYDSAGVLQWTHGLGIVKDAYTSAGHIFVDQLGNSYVSGQIDGSPGGPTIGALDWFVSKHDAMGNQRWLRQFGSATKNFGVDVFADTLGNVYMSGSTLESQAGPNAGLFDAFVIKCDSAGTHQWTRQFGTAADDEPFGVFADSLGNVFISGFTGGSLSSPSAGGADAFLCKYDAAGNPLWTRQVGTENFDKSNSITADELGNVFISGYTMSNLNTGEADAFVSKFDTSGNLQWTRQLGTATDDVSTGIATDVLGNVYISGYTRGSLGAPTLAIMMRS